MDSPEKWQGHTRTRCLLDEVQEAVQWGVAYSWEGRDMPRGKPEMHEIYYIPASSGEQRAQLRHEPIFLFLNYIDCDFLHLYTLALRSIQAIGAQA